MTTIAQEALSAHLLYQKQHWSTMITTAKDTWLRTREDLEMAAEAEIASNLAEQQAIEAQIAASQQAIRLTQIRAGGFAGDNSLTDYKTLYESRQDIFGRFWEDQAISDNTESTGIETFINLWLKYKLN